MKKLLILLLILALTIITLFGCELIGGKDEPDTEQGGETPGTDDPGIDETEPKRLGTPVVRISDRGIASWNAIPGATGYKIIVGSLEYVRTTTSIQLKDGDVITVQALGDGVTTLDSEFSKLMMYDPSDAPTVTTIEALASAPLDKVYSVKGLVCAAGKANLLLTDNKGNYVYVYTLDPHGYSVGDEVEFTGTKAAYWNVYELKDITSSTLISSGNEIETPFVKEGTADYFEDKLESFTVGELVTVTGRLSISGSYYNFEVEGLDGALLSLAYNGTLEDGKDYTATGYLAFISGSTAKYINIIVTEIKEVNYDDLPEICSICGVSVLIGDHSLLGCGHYACEDGEHFLCSYCGEYLCTDEHSDCGMPEIEYCDICGEDIYVGDHSLLGCGHYACDGMEHHVLDCGHRICDGGEHIQFGCGHFACEGGEHGNCAYCGGYLCTGDHSLCGGTEIIYCDACKGFIYEGDHTLQNCGHYICVDGEHGMYGCGHFTCADGDHSLLDCGHHVCQDGDHIPCEYCGIFRCVGDHYFCGTDVTEYCQWCGEDVADGVHFLQGCGHYTCVDGMHDQLDCGHYACEDGEHFLCSYCGEYLCTGDHSLLECGHFACQDGTHCELACGHYECEGGDHTLFGCRHCASMPGSHFECDKCGKYLCTGDHSSCGGAEEVLCNICGNNFLVGDHNMLSCGHYACEEGDHVLCERCETYRCQGDHTECDTPSEYCEICGGSIYVGDHYELDCGHCASLDGDHSFCERCGEYLCGGLDHTLYSCGHTACEGGEHYELACGHFACEDGEHGECSVCSGYLCVGEHEKLPCGHYSCDGDDHSPCLICDEPLCIGTHGEGMCVKLSKFDEIYLGENGDIFTTEGIICAMGAYEFLITDNEGNYLHVGFDEPHPYKTGDLIRITGNKVAYGNISYDLIPIEIATVSEEAEFIVTEPIAVDLDYFENGVSGGYKMGEYIRFVGYLDPSTNMFIVDGEYVGVVWTGIDIYYNERYIVTAYLYYLDSIDGYWVIATGFADESSVQYCSVCGGPLAIGDHYVQDCGHYICLGVHEMLPCGHYSCESGDHSQCDACGGYYCHGGSHTVCYGCKSPTCDGRVHDFCDTCGWFLCVGNHDLLECGHKACSGGDHQRCGVCGEYYCHGGDHSMMSCGHLVCSGGEHKICPSCYEPTCNAPDHPICEYCSEHTCVGTHKKCPACDKVTCNKPDHIQCNKCGLLKCVCVCEDEEKEFEFITWFKYSSIYQDEFEEKIYYEDGDESKPLILLKGYKYKMNVNVTVSFVPEDDGTFIMETFIEGYDEESGDTVRIIFHTFSGLCTLMDDGRYAIEVEQASGYEEDNYMEYPGTYFPFTKVGIVEVDLGSMSFVVPEFIAFIISDRGIAPVINEPCYYCNEIIVPGNVHLHVNTCDDCGKQFCESGGVEGHYYYNEFTESREHYPVPEDEIRTGVKYIIDRITGDIEISTEYKEDEEEEE